MRRIHFVSFFLAFVLLFSAAPAALGLAGPPPIEAGKKAGKVTTKAVIKAAQDFAEATKTPEGPASLMTQGAAQFASQIVVPITLFDARNVRALSDGRFRVDVSVGGWYYSSNWFSNQVWVFAKVDGNFFFDDQRILDSSFVPKGMTKQTISLQDDGSLSINGASSAKVEVTNVTLVEVQNSTSTVVGVGLYRLHKGVKVSSFTAAKADQLGVLIAGASASATQGFVGLEPGTYVLIPLTQDENYNFLPDPEAKPFALSVSKPKATPTPGTPAASPVAAPATPAA